jgi:hypothetical protein
LWLSLSPEEQKAWRSLLNPERFYDPKTNRVIELPDNYLRRRSTIASISYELGSQQIEPSWIDYRPRLIQFTSGKIFADDSPPTGDTIAIQTSTRATSGKQRRWRT